MPAFISLPQRFLYRASDAKDFVEAVHEAFDQDSDEATRARLNYAAANTWDVRVDRLREVLESEWRVPAADRADAASLGPTTG